FIIFKSKIHNSTNSIPSDFIQQILLCFMQFSLSCLERHSDATIQDRIIKFIKHLIFSSVRLDRHSRKSTTPELDLPQLTSSSIQTISSFPDLFSLTLLDSPFLNDQFASTYHLNH